MKHFLQKTKRRLLLVFAAVLALSLSTQVQAQTITENFEEAVWQAVTTSAGGNATGGTVNVTAYNGGTNATLNTGSWRYSSAYLVTNTTNVTNTTANSKTYTVHGGTYAFHYASYGAAYVMTPLLPNGVTSISYWARTASTSATTGIFIGTNQTMTSVATMMAATNLTGGGWQSSSFSTVNSTLGWAQVSFNITGNATSAPCYIKICRTSSEATIDDIVITTPQSCTTPTTYTVGGGTTICSGSSTNVTLSGSQSEVTYQLYKGGVAEGSTKAGTGSGLSWSVSAAGTYTVKTTTAGGYCETAMTGDAVIAVASAPTTAAAGDDQSKTEGQVATLAANNPSVGTGAWTVVSGPSTSSAQFGSTSVYNTSFTPAGGNGDYVLRWTISNSPCTASYDEVTISYAAAANPTLTLTSATGTDAQSLPATVALTNIVYTWGGTATTAGATWTGTASSSTPPTGVSVDLNNGAKTLTISGTPSVAGNYGYTVTTDGGTPAEKTGTITVTTPTITVAETQIDLSTTGWVPSSSTSRAVTGSNLVADISVSVTGPFQVSNNNSTWNTTATITKSGFTANGTLYVRYNPSSGDGTDSGTITISATGATSRNIDVTGTAAAKITLSSGSATQSVKKGVAITNIVYTVEGGVTGASCTGLPAGVTFNDETYTISGTPTTSTYQAYPYTVTIEGPEGTTDATANGTITVKDPNAITVAYLYGTGLAIGSDALYAYLDTKFDVDTISATTIGTTKSAVETFLADYDVVFQAESTTGGTANTNALEGISKPFVNAKHFTYTAGAKPRWDWGTPANGSSKICNVTVTDKLHPLFNGLTFTGDSINVLGVSANDKGVGYVSNMTFEGTVTLGYSQKRSSFIAIQEVPVGTTYETDKQTTHKYVMIAINSLSYQALTADGFKLYENAVKYVIAPECSLSAPTGVTSDSPQCVATGVTLSSPNSAPEGETWYWQTSATGTSTDNETPYNTTAAGTYYLRSYDGSCWSPASSGVSVTMNTAPSISAHPATGGQNLCKDASATALTVTASGSGLSYQWYSSNDAATNTSEDDATVGTDSNSYSPSTSSSGTKYYYCVVSGTCSPSATSNVSGAIVVSATSVGGTATALASSVCTGSGTTINLSGQTGNIQWQTNASSSWVDIEDETSTSYVTPNLTTTTSYRAVVTNGYCSGANSSTAEVTVNEAPTTSAAGSDQSKVDGLSFTLAANEPSVGTGVWSIVSSPDSGNDLTQFSSTSAYNATFTPKEGVGDYTLRWTISNAPCTASTDDVVLTVTFAGAPSLEHTSGSTSQTVSAGTDIGDVVYTWAGTATTAAVTWTGSSTSLPTGLSVDLDNDLKTLTISGTPSVAGTYNFSVKSNDGSSNYSDALTGTITVKLATPSVASGATTITNQGFTAQWSDVSGESNYTVKVYQAGDLVKTISNIDANEISVAVTGLSVNTSYTYKVTAIGNGDDVLDSNESSASSTVRTLSTAKAITAFTIAGVSATITEGTHTITATVPAGTDITSLTPSVTVSSYADYSPKTAQNFTTDKIYTVTAEDGSNQDYTITIALTLSAPTVSDATIPTNQGFTANWSAVSNASSYTVTVYQGESVATTITGETGTSVAVSGLNNNTSYTYKVQAIGNGTKYLNSAQSSASNSVRTLSTASSITSFTISGQMGDTTIDGTAISITMPAGTNRSSLTPTISVSANASVNPTSGTAQDFTSAVQYTVTAEDGTTQTVYTVTVTNAAGSSACDITAFSITDQVGATVIDGTSISITMPAGTMRYSLTPASITLSDYATVSPLATAAQDFRSPVIYTVTAQNGSSQKQYTVTVTNESGLVSVDNAIGYSTSYSMPSPGANTTLSSGTTEFKYTAASGLTTQTGYTILSGVTYNCLKIGSSANSNLDTYYIEGSLTSNSSSSSISTLKIGTTAGSSTANYAVVYSSVAPFSSSSVISGQALTSTVNTLSSMTLATATVPSNAKSYRVYRSVSTPASYGSGTSEYVFHLFTTVQGGGNATTPLTAPTVGSASSTTNQGFTANWSDVSNEIGYTVKVYQGASLVKTITGIAANATSVVVTGLDANTSYTYKVTAIGEGDVYTDSNESSASASVRTKNTAKDITAFTIAGVQAAIDGLDITAEVPYSTNFTSLTPSVTVSEYAEYTPSGAQDFTDEVEYTVTAEDGSQKVYTVSLTKAEASGACDITDFSISGQISSDIDGLNITVLMPYGSTVSSLTPTVETSLAASYGPSGAQNFSSPVEYTVTAENGINEKVYTVTVSIAEPTINACAGPFNFTTTGWSVSDVQYFTLTGSNLVADISVSVDAPFQISKDNTTWDTTTSLTKSGFTASGDIYIRYNPSSSSTGEDSGIILFSTTGADNSAIAVEGVAAAAINNPSNKNQAVKQGVAIENIVFTVTGGVSQATCTGLPAGVTFDDETYTISGTPTTDVYDAYPYTVTIQGLGDTEDAVQTGTITVKDPNAITVAYICNTTTLALASDALYQHLNSHLNFEVTAIGEASIGATKSAIESNLAAYDVVVLSESTTGSNANIIATEGISKPMVNGKHFVCGGTDDNTARWQWAKGNNGTVKTCTVTVTNTSHPVFAGLTLTDGTTTLVNYGMADNKAVGYIYDMTFTGATTLAYSEGSASKIAIQEVPVGTTYETGKQTTHKYVMIAVNNLSYQALTADGLKLYDNAIKYVASAQNLSDAFRSTADGTWTSPSAWESTSNGTTFATGVITPTANASAVTIANNITVPTTSSIQAPAILSIEPTGKLTVADDGQDYGTLTIPTGGKLIIESNDTATAQVKNDGEVVNNGTIVIRKTLTASKGWYFVSFPFDVDSTRVLIAGTDTHATWGGPVDEDYDFYVAEYDAERRDAEGKPNTTGEGNYWKAVSPKVLVKNRGYIIGADADITLDFVSGVSPTTTMFSATAEEDLVSYATNSANIHHSWNLMGIPFGSAFNFSNASQDQAPFYFHTGTQYVTIMSEDEYEAYPYTAFFLQRNPGATVPAKLSFASAGRTLKSLAVNRFDEVSLVVKNAKYSDKVRIRLQEDASAGYEIGKDAVKFFATKVEVPQIYSKQGNYVLSVNSVPVTTTEVSVTVKAGEEGNYTIAMEDIAKAVGCKQVILKDGNIETDLLADNEYSFSTTAGATKTFTVLFITDNTTAVTTTEGTTILIKTIGDKVYVSGLEGIADVCVYDVSGKLVERFAKVNNNDALMVKQTGIYVVDVKTATQQAKAKVSISK